MKNIITLTLLLLVVGCGGTKLAPKSSGVKAPGTLQIPNPGDENSIDTQGTNSGTQLNLTDGSSDGVVDTDTVESFFADAAANAPASKSSYQIINFSTLNPSNPGQLLFTNPAAWLYNNSFATRYVRQTKADMACTAVESDAQNQRAGIACIGGIKEFQVATSALIAETGINMISDDYYGISGFAAPVAADKFCTNRGYASGLIINSGGEPNYKYISCLPKSSVAVLRKVPFNNMLAISVQGGGLASAQGFNTEFTNATHNALMLYASSAVHRMCKGLGFTTGMTISFSFVAQTFDILCAY